MKDAKGDVIYVGKAKNLRSRVLSYFGKGRDTRYQIAALMQRTKDVEYLTVSTEKEALLLEYSLIQKHRPHYNIFFKDDKSYASIKISSYHDFPGIFVTRKRPKDGSLYFGPYTSAATCREMVGLLIRYFKIRNCSDTFLANRSRPCIQHEIGRCTAPCAGFVPKDAYKKQVEAAGMFLSGDTGRLLLALKEEMDGASKKEEYEEAARIRDVINNINEQVEPWLTTAVSLHKLPAQKTREGWNSISGALAAKLGLGARPSHIECIDISNISGRFAVGATVAFISGEKDKNKYRRYKIMGEGSPDDYQMMREVLFRRFGAESREGRPDILLIDGGMGHLTMAKRIMDDLLIKDIAVVAIAKGKDRKQDQIFLPGRKNPVRFRRSDRCYLFLKKVRDEAHRFSIEYYRKRHLKGIIASELENIRGVGPAKRKALLSHFKSIDAIRRASIEDMTNVPGITKKLARKILEGL